MATPMDDLKSRLRAFLSDPEGQKDFRVWFATALRDSHKQGQAFQSLAHLVQSVFADVAEGTYSSADAREILTSIADGKSGVVTAACAESDLAKSIYIASLENPCTTNPGLEQFQNAIPEFHFATR